jgi:hypothetical protein
MSIVWGTSIQWSKTFFCRPAVRALISLSAAAIFAGDAQAAGYATGHLTSVNIPVSGSYIRFWLDTAPVNPDGCSGNGFYMVELTPGSTSGSNFVAALLSAYATGRTVQFFLSGCTVQQYWGSNWPLVYDIYVSPN